MPSFNLTDSNDTLVLDMAGNVSLNGGPLGTWSVTPDNQVQIQQGAGGTRNIPVTWSFNGANELVLQQPNTANSFNFFGDINTIPSLSTSKAVLNVQPDSQNNFVFQLHPAWNLQPNFDMTVTIGSTTSTIDGLLGDRQDSGFDYIFQTNDALQQAYALNFTGRWTQKSANLADLVFTYDTESTPGTFDLPDGLDVDSTTNMLVYRANKNDQSSSVGLIGTLTINKDFSITYEMEESDNAGVKSSTLNIQAELVQPSVGSITLDLNLKRSAGQTKISISGTYQGIINQNTKLTVGFSYQRQVQGNTTKDTVGFQGEIQTSNDKFIWDITDDGQTMDITAHVTFLVGKTCGEASLNFQTSQGQVAVTAMFSISTGCTQTN